MQSLIVPLSSDSPSQLDILGPDGDAACVNSTQYSVLEQSNEICFSGFLKAAKSGALEAHIRTNFLSDLSHQSLEGQLADEKLGRLLKTPNFTQSHGAWPIASRNLHASLLKKTANHTI
jgi:hypothetical protein